MTYRALLIGNSVFDADASLNPLNAPVKDVARLHRALVDADTGLFADEHVRLVTERTCDDILDELDRFFAAGRRDDLLLLYYSGHGILDERNSLYICGRDTRSDRLLRTAISNVRVNEFVAQSMTQRIVIILDCCSSGMFKGGPVGAQLAGPGRYIISSTRGIDLANDAATATGTSLFTEHLVEGMLGAAVDANGDGYIDLREIYDYVRDRLRATTKQVPHCRFDGDAAVSMARVRVTPAVARVPDASVPRSAQPTFALAENAITIRDIEPDEQLPPEVVEVLALTDTPLDLEARTSADWLSATVTGNEVRVALNPRPGANRGKITIRDRASGSAQVLRVDARVRATAPAAPAPPGPVAYPKTQAPPDSSSRPPGQAAPETPAAPNTQAGPKSPATPKTQAPQEPPATPQAPGSPERVASPEGQPGRPRAVDWLGLSVAGLGALLLIVAFTSVGWYRVSGANADVSDMRGDAAQLHAGFAHTFLGWLAWLLIVAAVAASVAACVVAGHTRRFLGAAALALGALGIGLTLTALQDLADKLREQGVHAGIWLNTENGLYLALLGFALVGIAGMIHPLGTLIRRRVARSQQMRVDQDERS